MSHQTNNNSKVPWVVFVAVVTIFVTTIGWLFSVSRGAEAKAEKAISDVAEVRADIREINANLANIASSIAKIERKIGL